MYATDFLLNTDISNFGVYMYISLPVKTVHMHLMAVKRKFPTKCKTAWIHQICIPIDIIIAQCTSPWLHMYTHGDFMVNCWLALMQNIILPWKSLCTCFALCKINLHANKASGDILRTFTKKAGCTSNSKYCGVLYMVYHTIFLTPI